VYFKHHLGVQGAAARHLASASAPWSNAENLQLAKENFIIVIEWIIPSEICERPSSFQNEVRLHARVGIGIMCSTGKER
jgi:hypothetical protein